RTNGATLAYVHELVGLLYGVDSPRVPFEIIRSFENLANDLLGTDVRLMLKPSDAYNYEILDLGATGLPLSNAFLLYFPSAEASSFLIHTIFFHELGHPLFSHRVAQSLEPELALALAEAKQALDGQITAEAKRRLAAAGFPVPAGLGAQEELWEQRLRQER